MILDNVDDPTVFFNTHGRKQKADSDSSNQVSTSLSAFLPQTNNGSILVISRSRDAAFRLTGSDRDIVAVEPMDENHALELFKTKIQESFDEGDAKILLQALDYMPLAISQAAAYINQRSPRISVTKYLQIFQKSESNKARLLDTDLGDNRRDPSAVHSIFLTWTISFEYIRQERSSAARLLSLMSLFDRQGIPASLLHHRYEDDNSELDLDRHDGESLNIEVDSDLGFEDDVCTLRNYSLTRVTDEAGELFDMHRLVQLSTRTWLESHGEWERWKQKYIRIMRDSFPRGRYENWPICRNLFPHAQAVLAYPPATYESVIDWTTVLKIAAWYAKRKGYYLTAEKMIRKALDEEEKVLGLEHPETLNSVSDLVSVVRSQGNYELAEEMGRRALEGREKALGPDHNDTMFSVGKLAFVLYRQRKYEEAEEMSRRTLRYYEKIMGTEDPRTLDSVCNLASILKSQGKYEMAERMFRRALEGSEKVLGLEDPETLTCVSDLARLLRDQGNYEMAEIMYRRTLEGREKVLGLAHPHTFKGVYHLAYLFHVQNQYDDASSLYRKALAGLSKTLGPDHPYTQQCSRNYKSMIRKMRKRTKTPATKT